MPSPTGGWTDGESITVMINDLTLFAQPREQEGQEERGLHCTQGSLD